MRSVEINGKPIQIPESLEELNQKQYLQYIALVELQRHKLFTIKGDRVEVADINLLVETKVKLLLTILPLSKRASKLISPATIRDLVVEHRLVDFFFNDLSETNHLPTIKIGWFSKLYGPAKGFHRVSFEEFGMADDAYHEFITTHKPDHLYELVAILYRPKLRSYNPKSYQSNGDPREPFNHLNIDYRKKKIASINIIYLMGILAWFEQNRRLMLLNYAEVFDKKNTNSNGCNTGWLNTAMAIGRGVLNFHQIRKENVYLVFEEMKRLVNEHEKTINPKTNGSA